MAQSPNCGPHEPEEYDVSPDGRGKAKAKAKAKQKKANPKQTAQPKASSDDAHEIVYFKREPQHDATESMPGRDFLKSCPLKVRVTMRAVLADVASAPPKRYSGGGYWETMKDDMKDFYEVRVDGPNRHHYRLFCILDYEAEDATKPSLTVIGGLDKPFRTTLSAAQYAPIKALRVEYLSNPKRSVG